MIWGESGRGAGPISRPHPARTGARQFLKEVRQELTKVDWPTRRELVSYSIVVLVTITVLTTYVFGLDSLFTRFVFDVLGN